MSESAKKLQKLFGRALSHLMIRFFVFNFGFGDCSGGPQDAEMALRLCTYHDLLMHMKCPPSIVKTSVAIALALAQGVLTGKSLKVLREVLSGVLWEIGVLWGVLPRVLRETGGAPESAPEGALPVEPPTLGTLVSTPWSTPGFPEHPREHPPEHPRERFPEHFHGFPS